MNANLFVAGPFWAKLESKQNFYIPIPWNKIIAKKAVDEWQLKDSKWELENKSEKLEPDYRWQTIDSWVTPTKAIRIDKYKSVADHPWKYVSFLHPKIKHSERCVQDSNGLFLENSVQMSEDTCLVYLSTYPIENGWYRFGGENHLVEIESEEIKNKKFLNLLNQPIKRTFALVTPGIWGSNRFSSRHPQHESFPQTMDMLTDKPVPYRYRAKGNLGRGRYAVPSGSVYVLTEPLNKSWWEWDEAWFYWYGNEAGSEKSEFNNESIIKFEYASILWLPVFCPGQPIVWISSPRLLQRYQRIVGDTVKYDGKSLKEIDIPDPYTGSRNLKGKQSLGRRTLFFNLGFLTINKTIDLSPWFPSGKEKPAVIVDDSDISMIHDMALYRQSRVRLKPDQKVVDAGGFFNTEALPEGTILVFPIAMKDDKSGKQWEPLNGTQSTDIYLGGLESIGFGHCNLTFNGVVNI